MNTQAATQVAKEAATQATQAVVEKAPEIVEKTTDAAIRSGNGKVIVTVLVGTAVAGFCARGIAAAYHDVKNYFGKKSKDKEESKDETGEPDAATKQEAESNSGTKGKTK